MEIDPEGDVGGLLFEFDPTLCGLGLELDTGSESDWSYHYTHVLLLGLQFVLLWCLMREDKVGKMVK